MDYMANLGSPSLSSFQEIYQPADQTPTGFRLADLSLQGGLASQQSGENQRRILRDYSQFNLPDLTNRFAARGTFHSGSAGVAADRLRTKTSDQLADQHLGLSPVLSQLATNSVLAQTGFQL